MLELLEPYRGQRGRVQRLLEVEWNQRAAPRASHDSATDQRDLSDLGEPDRGAAD